MDEAQRAQLPNGSVYLNMRHRDSPSKGRGVALSVSGPPPCAVVYREIGAESPSAAVESGELSMSARRGEMESCAAAAD